jgi:hypothetical protein
MAHYFFIKCKYKDYVNTRIMQGYKDYAMSLLSYRTDYDYKIKINKFNHKSNYFLDYVLGGVHTGYQPPNLAIGTLHILK